VAQARDRFGAALAAGDFDNDGFIDLAIGVPVDNLEAVNRAGTVHILFGSAAGLTAANNQRFSQDTPDIKDVAEIGDLFGVALAAGDFDNDGFTDLAIGAKNEDLVGGSRAGVVHILYGSAAGLTVTDNQRFSQDAPDIKGVSRFRDSFGRALAAGDFDNDGFADLAIGVPGDKVGDDNGAGAVHILYGSAAGLTAANNQRFSQDSPDIKDVAETNNSFGAALATGDFNNDGFTDLAIGAPFEDVGVITDAGVVHILFGSAAGLTAANNQRFFQDTPDIRDVGETGDRFGTALTAGDFNNDGFTDLAIDVPFEDVGSITDAGAVHILYGSAAGLTAANNQRFTQDTTDIKDVAETDDRFGGGFEIFPLI
jgi:hypothetical protein